VNQTAAALQESLSQVASAVDQVSAADGVVPEGNLRMPERSQQNIMERLARLESGRMVTVERPVIKIPQSGEPAEGERRVARYGAFSRMNNRWYAANSESTHARLGSNPEEWAQPSAGSCAPPGPLFRIKRRSAGSPSAKGWW
jgi:hypothetical protein